MSNRRKENENVTRLIVATSDPDADMLYATQFWAPDPFIFLHRTAGALSC